MTTAILINAALFFFAKEAAEQNMHPMIVPSLWAMKRSIFCQRVPSVSLFKAVESGTVIIIKKALSVGNA